MPDWAQAVGLAAAVLALAALGASFGALLDARRSGAPGGTALLAPVAEAARLLRQRPVRRAGTARPILAAVLLLAAGLLLPALLVVDLRGLGVVVLGALLAVALVCARALVHPAGSPARAVLTDALQVALPPVLALAAPVIAARSAGLPQALAVQQHLWSAATMPVALIALLAGAVVAAPPAAAGLQALYGRGRLLAQAARSVLPAAVSAAAVPLLLGGGAGPVLPPWSWAALKATAVVLLLVGAARLLPALRPGAAGRVLGRVLLPLVAVQLLVVALVGAV